MRHNFFKRHHGKPYERSRVLRCSDRTPISHYSQLIHMTCFVEGNLIFTFLLLVSWSWATFFNFFSSVLEPIQQMVLDWIYLLVDYSQHLSALSLM